MSAYALYTKEELALRNGKEMPDIWVGYKGFIYDVTHSEFFKDGKHYFHGTGLDLTVEMNDAPHLDDVMQRFTIVGKLQEGVTILSENKLSKENIITDKQFTIQFFEKIEVSESIFRLRFSKPSGFTYTAGQYVKLNIVINGELHKRSYSLSSTPSQDFLEFLIQLKPQGKVSSFLIHSIKKSDTIQLVGPYGNFNVLPQTKELILICTDVGYGPIRSVIMDLLEKKSFLKISVVIGNRYLEDTAYREEIEALQLLFSNVTFIFVYSRDLSHANNGYVHPHYSKLLLNNANQQFFVVGWERMVNETKRNLLEKGISKEVIVTQLYC